MTTSKVSTNDVEPMLLIDGNSDFIRNVIYINPDKRDKILCWDDLSKFYIFMKHFSKSYTFYSDIYIVCKALDNIHDITSLKHCTLTAHNISITSHINSDKYFVFTTFGDLHVGSYNEFKHFMKLGSGFVDFVESHNLKYYNRDGYLYTMGGYKVA